MDQQTTEKVWVNNTILMLLVIAISATFLGMTRQFLMPIFLAALLSGLVYPVFELIKRKTGNKQTLAALLTLALLIILVLIPTLFLLGIFISQAVNVSQTIAPWIERFISEPSAITIYLEKAPFYEQLLPESLASQFYIYKQILKVQTLPGFEC